MFTSLSLTLSHTWRVPPFQDLYSSSWVLVQIYKGFRFQDHVVFDLQPYITGLSFLLKYTKINFSIIPSWDMLVGKPPPSSDFRQIVNLDLNKSKQTRGWGWRKNRDCVHQTEEVRSSPGVSRDSVHLVFILSFGGWLTTWG